MIHRSKSLSAYFLCLFFFVANNALAQSQNDSLQAYTEAFDKLEGILQENGSFKDAVFNMENAYFQNRLIRNDFERYIGDLVSLCRAWKSVNPLRSYKYSDSTNFSNNYAIYKALKDSISVEFESHKFKTVPYYYDFGDYLGKKHWSSMFVSKLLVSHSGNCHSLPYLYKILADELGAQCWLSLAPNHIYIKNRSKSFGWYNTELTSGQFPIDAWITAPGYIPVKAIQTGLYMDTLSNRQAIALCVLDLAKGYEHQMKNYYDGFILKCCDLVLKYHYVNPQAILLKAETLKKVYEKQKQEKVEDASVTFDKMQQTYIQLYDLGYREMPEKMYLDWLVSIQKEKNRFQNKALEKTIKNN